MADQTDRIEKLLDDFEEQRQALKNYVVEIEELKSNINQIFSKGQKDYRNFMVFEQKLRAATEFYKTILDMRREIIRTLKDESELRKKLLTDSENLENQLDISELVDRVEQRKKDKEKLEEKYAELEENQESM